MSATLHLERGEVAAGLAELYADQVGQEPIWNRSASVAMRSMSKADSQSSLPSMSCFAEEPHAQFQFESVLPRDRHSQGEGGLHGVHSHLREADARLFAEQAVRPDRSDVEGLRRFARPKAGSRLQHHLRPFEDGASVQFRSELSVLDEDSPEAFRPCVPSSPGLR